MKRIFLTLPFLLTPYLFGENPAENAAENTAEQNLTSPSPAIPLKWILTKVIETSPASQLQLSITKVQNSHPHPTLNRTEFLEYYRAVLTAYSELKIDPTPFIENTCDFLLTLKLTYDEVLDITISASPFEKWNPEREDRVKDKKFRIPRVLKRYQGLILVRLLKQQAPLYAERVLELTRFATENAPELAACLFPLFAQTFREKEIREQQLESYRTALNTFSDRQMLIRFLDASSAYLYRLNPSIEHLRRMSAAIQNSIPTSGLRFENALETQNLIPPSTEDFLLFHLKNHALSLGFDRFAGLMEIYRDKLETRWRNEIQKLVADNPNTPTPSMNHFRKLKAFLQDTSIVQNFILLSPYPIRQNDIAQIEKAWMFLTQWETPPGAILDYHKAMLRRAKDAESFATIFKMNPILLRETANLLFADFLKFEPSIPQLVEIYGAEKVLENRTVGADEFISILISDITHSHWQNPDEFEAFLWKRLPSLFSLSPEVEIRDLLNLQTKLRKCPVPRARELLEKEIATLVTAVPGEDILKADARKRQFLNFAIQELNICGTGFQCFQTKQRSDRERLRERLLSLLEPALSSYYGANLPPHEKLVRLFADITLHEELNDVTPAAHLLLLVADQLAPNSVSMVVDALHSTQLLARYREELIQAIQLHAKDATELSLAETLERAQTPISNEAVEIIPLHPEREPSRFGRVGDFLGKCKDIILRRRGRR